MAAGLPVVATSVGAVPELVRGGNCGWICPPADSASLAAALLSLLRSPERLAKGSAGKEYVGRHHSVLAMSEGYELLFKQLLRADEQKALKTLPKQV